MLNTVLLHILVRIKRGLALLGAQPILPILFMLTNQHANVLSIALNHIMPTNPIKLVYWSVQMVTLLRIQPDHVIRPVVHLSMPIAQLTNA